MSRKEPFCIATGRSTEVTNFFLALDANNGLRGWGSAAPNTVTCETKISIGNALMTAIKKIANLRIHSVEDGLSAVRSTCKNNPSVKAAIDMALYDLFSNEAGQSLYKYLREKNKGPVGWDKNAVYNNITTDVTIGIMCTDDAVKRAKAYCMNGFKALNIKVGLNLASDVERVIAIRKAVGHGVNLRVDANQGYTVKEALSFAHQLEMYDIELFEQPVSRYDWNGLSRVAASSPIPISADEAVHDTSDIRRLGHLPGGVRIANLKLMKCGGISEAFKIARAAAEAGITLKVGCMAEGRLSCAAAMHFAIACRQVKYSDIDSFFSLLGDPAMGGILFRQCDGTIGTVPGRTGIGASVSFRLPRDVKY